MSTTEEHLREIRKGVRELDEGIRRLYEEEGREPPVPGWLKGRERELVQASAPVFMSPDNPGALRGQLLGDIQEHDALVEEVAKGIAGEGRRRFVLTRLGDLRRGIEAGKARLKGGTAAPPVASNEGLRGPVVYAHCRGVLGG